MSQARPPNQEARGAFFPYDCNVTVSYPMALYAIWKDPAVMPAFMQFYKAPYNAHYISFYSNGGTGFMNKQRAGFDPPGTPRSVTVDLDTINSSKFYKDGWLFYKWDYTPDGSGTIDDGGSVTISSNITLFAIWRPAVIYYGNGSTSGTAPATLSYEIGATVTVQGSNTLERVGYTFAGWNTKADGSGTHYNAGATFTIDDGVKLYAQWVPTITITYNGNGAAQANYTQSTGYDLPTTLTANTFTKDASPNVFKGWATTKEKADAGTVDHADQAAGVQFTENTTLYAVWGES